MVGNPAKIGHNAKAPSFQGRRAPGCHFRIGPTPWRFAEQSCGL